MTQKQHSSIFKRGPARPVAALTVLALLVALTGILGPARPVHAAGPFTVNTINDSQDDVVGDAFCADAGGFCSLRAAIEEATALGGPTTINISSGNYDLSLGELQVGNLDGTNITLVGQGSPADTIISQTDGANRVFNIDFEQEGDITVSISHVTIRNGMGGIGGGGGGILAGSVGDALTLTDVVFNNNRTSAFNGGAISFTGGGDLSMQDSVFINNSSPTGNGGAIHFLQTQPGNLTVAGSTFVGNSASGGGLGGQGGAINAGCSNCSPFSITNSIFIGNVATGSGLGGAVMAGAGILVFNFNRIVGNSADDGSGVFNGGGTVDATNNWWGCNDGPGAPGCDTAVNGSGTLTTNPRIVLSLVPNPGNILPNGTSNLTASFLQNSGSTILSSGQVSALVNDPVAWSTNATFGALSGEQFAIQGSGTATALFTSNGTPGASSTSATVDNQLLTAGIAVDQAPAITSADTTTFRVGTPGTFTVTTTGFPAPFLSETGALPNGVTFVNNGGGTATLAGTPAAGTGGSYPITITAANGIGSDATQAFTLTVNAAPAITSASGDTFAVGEAGSFTVTTTGFPNLTLSETGALPSGVTFTDNSDGTATLAGTPAVGTGGIYPLTITAANGVLPDATQSFSLTVIEPAVFTSANNTTFTVGLPGTFSVTTSGFPTPVLSEDGALPNGVTFTDNGDGTATLAGTPAAGTGGTYLFTITAADQVGLAPSAVFLTQNFTLTVNAAPAITSANNINFLVGAPDTFTVTTAGFPTPTLSASGALPNGITFVDNGDGTATLGGTPAALTGGIYPLTITAANGIMPDATQTFTLTVFEVFAITSPNNTTFTVGTPGTFTVTTLGFPKPALSETGALPTGVTFTDNHDGSATLAGTPVAGTGGIYPITIRTSSQTSLAPAAGNPTQSFTLTVNEALSITSANSAAFAVGGLGSFDVTTFGFPFPALSATGALPGGVTFVDNADGTATLSGTPAAGTGGTYPLTFTASNGATPDATQNFTLTVNEAPAITSAASATFTAGAPGTFSVAATGFPLPALSETGALPTGVTFTDNGDGTATLAGTPAANTGGTYPLTIQAANGVGSDAIQSFTLTVSEPLAFTSANHVSFVLGLPGTFTVITTGTPLPSLSETGALPTGVTFVDNGDGTATLSGTPAAGTTGSYPLTLTAQNGVATNATQAFTLTVGQPPAITSADNAAFTIGVPGTFTVTTTGLPAPALSETGALPAGVTFVDNGNGTATLAGTPGAGTNGPYSLTITAANGVLPDATQAFSLVVSKADASITLTPAPNPSRYGQSVTIAASITSTAGSPGGTVQFSVDGTETGAPVTVSGGTASLTTSALAAGPHSLTAVYSGNPSFNSATSAPVTQTVIAANTLITLTFAASPFGFGLPVTFTATVTAVAPGGGTPTGSVSFHDGATLLGTVAVGPGGVAVLSTSTVTRGDRSITVDYVPANGNYNPQTRVQSVLIPYRLVIGLIFK